MRKNIPSRGLKLGLFALSSVVILLALEGAFRLFGIRGEYHRPRVDEYYAPQGSSSRKLTANGFQPYLMIRCVYDSNPRGYFNSKNAVIHRLNSMGWRDLEHRIEKTSGTYRILGLGDSYLFGFGVKRPDICINKLGKLLNDREGAKKVETINAGITAFNTANERDLLLKKGLQYEPDLVILHFVLNDVEEDLFREGPKVEFYKNYSEIYQTPDVLSEWSHLWGWIRQRYLYSVRARAYIRECLESFIEDSSKWNRCRSALEDIKNICAEHGAAFLVVIFPFFHDLDGDYPFQPIHDTVRTYCESSGIHVLDLRDHYRRFHGPELWVHPTDQHPNETAHEVAALAIGEYLMNHPEVYSNRRTGEVGDRKD